MAITDSEYDDRAQSPWKDPIAKRYAIETHAETSSGSTSITSSKFVANGVLKQFKYMAPDLTTDTQFSFEILDQDSGIVYSSGNLSDNTTDYVRIAEDSCPLLCSGKSGTYTIKISWTTGQIVTANSFKVLLFLANQ